MPKTQSVEIMLVDELLAEYVKLRRAAGELMTSEDREANLDRRSEIRAELFRRRHRQLYPVRDRAVAEARQRAVEDEARRAERLFPAGPGRASGRGGEAGKPTLNDTKPTRVRRGKFEIG